MGWCGRSGRRRLGGSMAGRRVGLRSCRMMRERGAGLVRSWLDAELTVEEYGFADFMFVEELGES